MESKQEKIERLKKLPEMWRRFRDSEDTRYAKGEEHYCFHCPYGEAFEVGEVRDAKLYGHWPNYRDGKLWLTECRPKRQSNQCQMCFESWLSDRMDDGKICVSCGNWVKVKDRGMWLEIGERKLMFCLKCALEIIQRKTKKEA